ALDPWAPSCRSVRQFDFVGMFLVPLVFFRKNPFEPSRLSLSNPSIHECGLLTYDELLAAAVTPHGAHLQKIRGCLFSGLTFLYGYCLHLVAPTSLHFEQHCPA